MNIPQGLQEKKKEMFHLKHEFFTELIYRLPNLLPDRYTFVLTNLCNLKCHFCFQKKDLREERMHLEDWLHLAQQLPFYARVTLTGGEPFMFPKFEEIFSFVAGRFDCNMISNGLLLTEERIEFLLSFPKFRVLSISIDNVGNTLREVTPKQWTRTENMMRHFYQRKLELKSNCVLEAKTVVLDDNAEELLTIHRYCMEELQCDHHSFQFLKGSPTQHADYMFSFNDILKKSHAPVYKKFSTIKEQLEKVRQYNLHNGKTAFLHPKIANLNCLSAFSDIDFLNEKDFIKENFHPCKFPWSSVHVNVDGNLFPCMAVAMGNVKETSLVEIIHGKQFNRFKDLIRREGTVEGCNRCGWLRPTGVNLLRDKEVRSRKIEK